MTPAGKQWKFGDLLLDEGTFSLSRAGDDIALPKQTFELLHCLVRHAPNVVSVDQLMDEVWAGRVVNEDTVKQRVKLLRQSLGDDSAHPVYVASIRGRGYRLLPEVQAPVDETSTDTIDPDANDPVQKRSKRLLLTIIAMTALAAIVALVALNRSRQLDTDPISLNSPPVSIPGSDDYLENFLSEHSRLAISRGGTENKAAFEAWLKGRQAYRRWTQSDNEVAIAFYQQALEHDAAFALALAGLANAHALRGTEFGYGADAVAAAEDYARQALERVPDLPEALKALGIIHYYRGLYDRASAYFAQAVEAQSDYDEALFNLAEISQLQGRWDDAVSWQLKDSTRPRGQEALSIYLRNLGLDREADDWVRRFQGELPLSLFTEGNLAFHAIVEGDYTRARQHALRLRESFPDFSIGWLRDAEIDLLQGNWQQSEDNFHIAAGKRGPFGDYCALRKAQFLLVRGEAMEAEALLLTAEANALAALEAGHQGWFHHWNLAFASALRGDEQAALKSYGRAVESGRRWFEWDQAEPVFESLNRTGEFKQLLQFQQRERERMRREVSDYILAIR